MLRRPSAKQAVPVTIACRPKPKEINNQIVKDHFQGCDATSETVKDSSLCERVNLL
jgi:hypothetical protein